MGHPPPTSTDNLTCQQGVLSDTACVLQLTLILCMQLLPWTDLHLVPMTGPRCTGVLLKVCLHAGADDALCYRNIDFVADDLYSLQKCTLNVYLWC
jgi:hypothetical protein